MQQPNELTREQRELTPFEKETCELIQLSEGNVVGFAERHGYDPCPAIKLSQELMEPAWKAAQKLWDRISELEAQLKDAIERCQKLNGIEARIEDLIAVASESGKYPKLHAWFDGDESADTDIDRGVQIWIRELEAQLAEAKKVGIQSAISVLSKANETNGANFVEEFMQMKKKADSALALAAMRGEALEHWCKAINGGINTNHPIPGGWSLVDALHHARKAFLTNDDPEEWLAERYVSKEDADRINSQLVWAVNFLRGIGFAEQWMAAIPIKVSADQQGAAWLAERDKRMRAEGAAEYAEKKANEWLNFPSATGFAKMFADEYLNEATQIRKEAGLL